MKNYSRTLALLSVCSTLVLLVSPPASAQQSRFYVRTDVGGQVTQDTRLLGFFGEPLAPDAKVKFDPGIRLAFAGGYRVTDWFAGDVETGVMTNNISSIGGASRADNATYSNVPLLLNARFECPSSKFPLSPYIGGGFGMSASAFDCDHIDIGGTSLSGSQATVVFAYQAFGGIRYRLNDRMGLSVEYHYFATTDSSWDVDASAGTSSSKMKFGGTQTHTASIAFDFRF